MNKTDEELSGLVLEIQRMSTEDGPGIRSTVFLKGCPLSCIWCHNPESISPRPQLHWTGSRCIGCRLCIGACRKGVLSFNEGQGVSIARDRCDGCGVCADECPSTALEMLGRNWGVSELAAELAKDRAWFEKSGGGVTLSGGEVTMQTEFSVMLLSELQGAGIHTAIDTCGQCAFAALEKLLPHSDLVLYDIKEIDPEKHKRFTGQDNRRILDNLLLLAEKIRQNGNSTVLWIRTPVIPEATEREDNIKGIGRFIAEHLNGVAVRWELCAFNNLCRDKYSRLGLEWRYAGKSLLSMQDMERIAAWARESGVDAQIVSWSGGTRIDNGTAEIIRPIANAAVKPC